MENKHSKKARGLDILQKMHPDAFTRLSDEMKDICPEMSEYIAEFAYGTIYTRETLDIESRSLCTISILTTLGGVTSELKAHIQGALNLGISKEKITETIVHTLIYAGFPRALEGLKVAKEVFLAN